MNKKTAIILSVSGLVLIIILAAVLICLGNREVPNTGATGDTDVTDTVGTLGATENAGTTATDDVEATDGLGGEWGEELPYEQNNGNASNTLDTEGDSTAIENGNTSSSGDSNTSSTIGTDTTEQQNPTGTTGENNQVVEITFEEYLEMTGNEQLAYAMSFPNIADYLDWYNRALQEYDKGAIDVTGPIDLEDYG